MSAPDTRAGLDLRVRRDDVSSCEVVETPAPADIELEPGQALLAIDAFALTANNVTYTVMGDMMGYWRFFPAPEGWGRVPVWGFAEVARSAHDDITAGERVFGYLPMSTHLVIEAAEVSDGRLVDAAAHRADLPAIYNEYRRSDADPGYDAEREAEQMILRPLFATGFLLDDFFAEHGFYGAERVVLSAASSKTAYATAFGLAARDGLEVVGLTSEGNRAFVEGLGCYDRVLAYADAASLADGVATLYVDFAGSGELRAALHRALGDDLRHDCIVGVSHHSEMGGAPGALPGPAPQLFSGPAQAAKRIDEWGGAGFQERLATTWTTVIAAVDCGAMRVVRDAGPDAVERVWRDLVAGRVRPEEGHVLSLREPAG